jgi:branched-chain amino acid transport system permease protein
MLVFGAAMVAIILYRPRGLVSTRKASISLHRRREIPTDAVDRTQSLGPA